MPTDAVRRQTVIGQGLPFSKWAHNLWMITDIGWANASYFQELPNKLEKQK